MKHSRKTTAALMALMMCASLAACEGNESTAETSAVSQTESSVQENSGENSTEDSTEDSEAGGKDESSQSFEDSKSNDESSEENSVSGDESSRPDSDLSSSGAETSKKEENAQRLESSQKSESSGKEESSKSSSGGSGSSSFVVKSVSAESKTVLDNFMKGLMNADRNLIKSNTNFDVFFEAAIYMYGAFPSDESSTMSREQMEDELFSGLADSSIVSYKILRSAQNEVLRGEINDSIKEMKQEFAELDSEEKQKYKNYLDALLNNYTTISECNVFEVEIKKKDGSTDTQILPVTRTSNGMKVDLLYASALGGYTERAKVSSANSAAKSVYTAAMSGLTDMDAEDADIKVLDGTMTFTGSDFKNVSRVEITSRNRQNKETLLKYLKYSIQQYFNNVTELDSIGIVISKGNVTAVAVHKGDSNDPVTGEPHKLYGTWPKSMTKDDSYNYDTLAKALKYAPRDEDR